MRELLGSLAAFNIFVGLAFAGVVDERLYVPSSGDEIIDSGEMIVSRQGNLISREEFEVVRREDGGRTIVSTVTAADERFRVQARWDYDAAEDAISARGWGKHGERAFEVEITPTLPDATMAVTYESGETEIHKGACPADCLIDMMPGALPQFTMTRRYDYAKGGNQDFRWMAFMLNMDMRSFDVDISVAHARNIEAKRADGSTITIRQFVFDEKGTLDGVGEAYDLHSNLWVDEAHRPIKFKAGQTIGLRVGFEDVDSQLTPQ